MGPKKWQDTIKEEFGLMLRRPEVHRMVPFSFEVVKVLFPVEKNEFIKLLSLNQSQNDYLIEYVIESF